MSLGAPRFDNYIYEALANYDGLAIVAAGNSDTDLPEYPGALGLPNIINVGALDKSGNRADFSNYNKNTVDIFAPGQEVYSTCSIALKDCSRAIPDTHDEDQIVSKMSGTSMSAPIVTGIAATIYSQNPKMSIIELKRAIIDGAITSPSLNNKATTNGYLNALKANKFVNESKTNATHKAILNGDGSINLWGSNDFGQLGNGTNSSLDEANSFKYKVTGDQIIKYYLTKGNTYLVTKKGDLYVSGKNDINQLSQKKSGNSNKFVKFNKINAKHMVSSIEFRNRASVYDEDSIKINLKSIAKNQEYYRLGNDSFKIESDILVRSKEIQYVINKDNYRFRTLYYQPLTNKLINEEQVNYSVEKDEGETYTYRAGYTSKKYYASFYTQKDYDEFNEREVISNKNYKNTYLKKTVRHFDIYNIFNAVDFSESEKRTTMYLEKYSYRNGEKTKVDILKYNQLGQTKSNSYGYSYRKSNNYNVKGKMISSYKALYNAKGKKGKNNLVYKISYIKKGHVIINNTYTELMQRTKYKKISYSRSSKPLKSDIIIYKGKRKVAYQKIAYKQGLKNLEYLYKYNNKGQLKTKGKSKAFLYIKSYKKGKLVKTYRYTYNNKGKKINKVLVYSKKGGRK